LKSSKKKIDCEGLDDIWFYIDYNILMTAIKKSPKSVADLDNNIMKNNEASELDSAKSLSPLSNEDPISIRDEIALKKEKILQEKEANNTFQPKLSARRKSDMSEIKPSPASRFDRLYYDAIKRQVEEPKLKLKVDESNNTFKPSISPKAMSSSTIRKPADLVNSMHNAAGAGRVLVEKPTDANTFKPVISKRASSLDRSSTDASARLYASKDIYKANLEKKKAEDFRRNAEKCSFSPVISSRMRSRISSSDSVGSVKSIATEDRLHLYAEKKKSKLEETKRLQLERDMADTTFKPTLISNSKTAGGQRGRDQTMKVVQGSRFDHLYKDAIKRMTDDPLARAKVDESHWTFAPKISPKARSISIERRTSGELVDSLHNATGSGRVIVQEKAEDMNSYRPTITKRASSLERTSPIPMRLYACKELTDENLDKLKYEAAVREFEECTFAPDISPSNRLSRSGPNADGASINSLDSVNTVDRLLEYGELKKRKLLEEKRIQGEREMLDVTFQPKLTSSPRNRSEVDYAESNQFNRLYSDAIKRQTEDPFVRARLDESHMTFQPKISKLANSLDKSTFSEINQRQKEVALKKKEDEVYRRAQLALSTHQPLISRRASSLDRSSLDVINQRQKEITEKKKLEASAVTDRENTFSPKLHSVQSARGRSRSSSIDSNSSVLSGRSITSPTNASIAARFTKPTFDTLRAEAMAKAKVLKEKNDLAKANELAKGKAIASVRSPSKLITNGNLSARSVNGGRTPPVPPISSRSKVPSLPIPPPVKLKSFSKVTSDAKPIPSTEAGVEDDCIPPSSATTMPLGRKV
jgi:hypothetical protein